MPGLSTILLVGMVGTENWPAFSASPEYRDGAADPLDRYSTRVISALAGEFGATALFPFAGPPWLPFQRWAMRAEAVAPSPLGLLIHPRYGLWHSYRGALGFAEALDLPPRRETISPCDGCAERPCLTICPVAAFSGRGYDVESCATHLRAPQGRPCLTRGCLARRACPAGDAHPQSPEAAGFHMRAFLASRAG